MTLQDLETIYEREYPNLVKIARHQLRKTPVMVRSEEPEDIVQSVFAYLLEAPAIGEDPRYMTLVNEAQFPGYLREAVLTRIYNLVRHGISVRDTHADLGYLERRVQSEDQDVRQVFEQVVEGVGNPKVRELLRLIVLGGWRPQEAADYVGLNFNYARSCIKRMRQRMREKLHGE